MNVAGFQSGSEDSDVTPVIGSSEKFPLSVPSYAEQIPLNIVLYMSIVGISQVFSAKSVANQMNPMSVVQHKSMAVSRTIAFRRSFLES